jgi:aquaporin Z
MDDDMSRRVVAEFFGTFWLVLGGCGAAILAAAFPIVGIGFLGVAFAFGLTVLTMAYAVGHISGGHFNPAVTIGLWSAGRCANKHVIPYIIAQVIGAIARRRRPVAYCLGQTRLGDGKFCGQRLRRTQPR